MHRPTRPLVARDSRSNCDREHRFEAKARQLAEAVNQCASAYHTHLPIIEASEIRTCRSSAEQRADRPILEVRQAKPPPRREFLRMSIGALGLLALGWCDVERTAVQAAAFPPQLTHARKILERLILQYARAKDNPWLLIHGIRALGKGFSLNEGSALDYLCSHCLEEKSVNGSTYLSMPNDYEGHPNCFLSEAVLDAGVPLNFAFQRDGRWHTIADVVAGAKAMFDPATTVPNDLGWSLVVFAHTTKPEEDSWINLNTKTIHFSDVVEFALISLERATERLMHAMHSNSEERGEDGIDSFFCAGTHLIYGLTTCLRFGHNQHRLPARMKPQFDLLIWRLGVDERLIDRYYDQVAEQYPPELARLYLLDTKLKFLGHR